MDTQTTVGWILAIFGILLTIYYAKRQSHRRLVWEVREDRELSRVSSEAVDHEFLGTPRVVTIRISNKGREAISAADYDDPVTFICRSLPIEAHIGETSSNTLRPEAVLLDGRVSYKPLLLNRHDWFDLIATFDDSMGPGVLNFNVHRGRVSGVDTIENWTRIVAQQNRGRRIAAYVAGALLITSSAFMLSAAGIETAQQAVALSGWILSIAGVLILLLAAGLLRPGRLPSKLRK